MKDYEEALNYIHGLPRFSGKPSLKRIRKLLALLGNPHLKMKFIHVAGTNGKGSTSAMTAEVLKQSGFKTGLFISPYILDFRERIQINGEFIPAGILTNLTNTVAEAVKLIDFTEGETIGEFEFNTALAIKYFEISHCDIVVLEVGIGGRFDATNVIESPEVCAITSISYDHMAILGDTLPKIAMEKCGIIKENAIVVSYPCQKDEVMQTIRAYCTQKYADLVIPKVDLLSIRASSISGSDICYKGLNIHIPLIGEHQIYNTLVVIEILLSLKARGWQINDGDIVNGIANVHFPGRLEVMNKNPLVLFDGAHNEDGVAALCKVIDTYLNNKRILMILGMVSDKAYESCIRDLARRAQMVIAVEVNNPRSLNSKTVSDIASEVCSEVYDLKYVDSAMCKAFKLVRENDVILVCGSLYLVSEAEKTFFTRHKPSQ